jgi:hypothetical protein
MKCSVVASLTNSFEQIEIDVRASDGSRDVRRELLNTSAMRCDDGDG